MMEGRMSKTCRPSSIESDGGDGHDDTEEEDDQEDDPG